LMCPIFSWERVSHKRLTPIQRSPPRTWCITPAASLPRVMCPLKYVIINPNRGVAGGPGTVLSFTLAVL